MWNAPQTGIPVRVDKYSKVFAIRRVATPSNGISTGGVTNAGFMNASSSPIQPFIDAVKGFDKAFTVLSDGHMWVRILEVVSGGTLVYLATKAN
jgi:hypothetical protein